MRVDYILGLDLGQVSDFTALAVLERSFDEHDRPYRPPDYALRHLQRFPRGTPYTDLAPALTAIASRPPFLTPPVVVDQTGVGRAVIDLLRKEAHGLFLQPVTITGGQTGSTVEDGSFHVPKKDLVGALQVLFQSRRLVIARGLPESEAFVKELQNFQVRITQSANETFGVWRDGVHDDLVLAAALAAWWAGKHPPFHAHSITSGGGSKIPPNVFGRRPKGGKFPRGVFS